MSNVSSTDALLTQLQQRIQDLELSKTHMEVTDILKAERTDILLSLRKILSALNENRESDDTGRGATSKEIEDLKAENERLKKINSKQEYRIQHLVHNLRTTLDGDGNQ